MKYSRLPAAHSVEPMREPPLSHGLDVPVPIRPRGAAAPLSGVSSKPQPLRPTIGRILGALPKPHRLPRRAGERGGLLLGRHGSLSNAARCWNRADRPEGVAGEIPAAGSLAREFFRWARARGIAVPLGKRRRPARRPTPCEAVGLMHRFVASSSSAEADEIPVPSLATRRIASNLFRH